jgi:mannose/fructose/N-acetylgalactosamine-specific phosphotransferase system component IID
MWIIAIAWMFVAVLMAIAEAVSPVGSVLGAVITLLFYGVLPCSLLMYILTTGQRKRARQAAELRAAQQALAAAQASAHQPDAGSLPPSDSVTTK